MRTIHIIPLSLLLPVLFPISVNAAERELNQEVFSTRKYTDASLQMTVITGRADVPATYVPDFQSGDLAGLNQPQALLINEEELESMGRRADHMMVEQEIQSFRRRLYWYYHPLLEYAREHGGTGPANFAAVEKEERFQEIYEENKESVFLIPDVAFHLEAREGADRLMPSREKRQELLLQLNPYTDDGKHWVLFTDGSVRRVEVSQQLLDRHGLELRIRRPFDAVWQRENLPPAQYQIFALAPSEPPETAVITFRNPITGDALERVWRPRSADAGDREMLSQWANLRASAWNDYAQINRTSILQTWLGRQPDIYGDPSIQRDAGERIRNRNRRGPGNETTALSLLGGRAAIEETLQLYLIDEALSDEEKEQRTIPIEELEGVRVEAHPFEEMLQGKEVEALPLANYVPDDRFFVYFSNPTVLPAMLDRGSPFISHAGTLLTANDFVYDLETAYLARLGMNRDTVRWLLESGLLEEFAIYTPDLFLIEGTEITVVAQVKQNPLFRTFLKMIGLGDEPEGIRGVPTSEGDKAYWATDGALLFVGTSLTEVSRAVALASGEDEGSLGESAEFRYMLHKQPLREESAIYVYLSDRFIRRLTGPEVKIGQLRRARAQAAMEAAAGARLLRRLDTAAQTEGVGELVRLNYLPAAFRDMDLNFDESGLSVSHGEWGRINELKPLSRNPVRKVSEKEKQAYDAYRANYTRYWRRFFDPIAIRFDYRPDKLYEVSTFILPLVDNSIYNNVRRFVMSNEHAKAPLDLPHFETPHVMSLSINLREEAWRDIIGDLFGSSYNTIDVDPRLLDQLGPEAHLFVLDDDPIFRLGGSELIGLFGERGRWMGGNDMFMLPVMVSLLTRPCDLAIKLKDPELTRMLLANARTGPNPFDEWVTFSLYRVGEGELVLSMEVLRSVKWDFGLRVDGDYLLVNNHPWTRHRELVRAETLELSGAALEVHPDAMQMALAASFGSAMERERLATFRSMAHLLPWLEAGAANPEEAVVMNEQMFGFRPSFPREQQLNWNGEIIDSDLFGNIHEPRQPAFSKAGGYDFGLFRGLEGMRVQMQLEEDGLRSVISWRPANGAK